MMTGFHTGYKGHDREETGRQKLRVAIDRSLARGKNSVRSAAIYLEKMAREDNEIFEELMSPHLEKVCLEAIRGRVHDIRQTVWRNINESRASTDSGTGRLDAALHASKLFEKSLLDFPLLSGTKLKKARRAQVREAADFYLKQGADMLKKGQWLQAVESKMDNKRTVGQTYTESELRDLIPASAS